MQSRRFVGFSGLAAIVGGVLWSLFAVLASLKPVGCIAATCALRPMRYTTDLAPIMISAVLLLLVGLLGLLAYARWSGGLGRTMKAGMLAALSGAGILALALFIQAVFYAGDFPAMPTLVIPGAVLMALGVLAIGIGVLRLMPRWIGGLLVAAAVAFVFANDQDARVLLYIPFGLAWIAVGRFLAKDAARRMEGSSTGSSGAVTGTTR